jgi:hypothetical protein
MSLENVELGPRDKSPYSCNDETLFKELVKKRGFIKGRLTNFKNYILSLNIQNLTPQSRLDVKLHIHGATKLYSEFDDIQSKLEELSSDMEEQLTQRNK